MTELVVRPDEFSRTVGAMRDELHRVIVGQDEVIEHLLVAFFAGGHALLEGVPGLGKTLLAKSFAQALGLSFHRIQCTPDLMPADILGTQLVVDRDGGKAFEFSKGPVFTHILLADEINRATPKTQSALLEAMGEQQVTISGTTFHLEEPFFVIATQNPIEMEGSLPLDETVLVNGRLAQGTELLAEAKRAGATLCAKDGKALHHLPGLRTWTLTPHGELEQRPCQVYTMPYQGDLFRVQTKTGREIRVTAEHPFLVNHQGEIRWKLAKDLCVDDYLVVPSTLPQSEECVELMTHRKVMEQLATRYRVVRHEELLDIVARSEQLTRPDRLTARDLNNLRIASRLTKRQLAQRLKLSRRDYWQLVRFFRRGTSNRRMKSMLVRYFRRHPVDLSEVRDLFESWTINSVKRFPVTPDIAGWLGFLLSDGTVGRSAIGAFQKNYPEALDAFIRTTTEQVGTEISDVVHRPCGRAVWIRSKPLVDYLRLRFGVTRSGVIPPWIVSLPQEHRRAFLRHFISLESHCAPLRRRITCVQKRKQAVNVIMHLLLLEGVISWARKRPMIYELRIQGEDFQKFLDQVGWVDRRVVERAQRQRSDGRSSNGHDYSPFRIVPVPPQDLVPICDLLGINSFHTAKDRTWFSTRSWYGAYRFGRRTGIVSQAKLRQRITDVQHEVNLRQREDLDVLVSQNPRKAARLCGLSLPDIAEGIGVSNDVVWNTYAAPADHGHPAISTYIKQQFTNRMAEVQRLTTRLERLTHVHYDKIERITTRPYAGQVFGLTVPGSQNYLAGFGACGISHNTFPLPEAQLDRFLFKIFVGYPSSEELSQIIRQTTSAQSAVVQPVLPAATAQAWILAARRLVREVLVASPIEAYIVKLVSATRPNEDGAEDLARRFLRYGASPRGAQAILLGAKVLALLNGRVNVSVEDVDRVLLPALSHRVILSFEAEADKRTAPDILTELTAPLRRDAPA